MITLSIWLQVLMQRYHSGEDFSVTGKRGLVYPLGKSRWLSYCQFSRMIT